MKSMNVRKILSVCKNKINFYSYLYLGVTLMSGRMSFNKYKRLKADLKVLKSQYSDISELFRLHVCILAIAIKKKMPAL